VPKIEIAFTVNTAGEVTVGAHDLGTGVHRSVDLGSVTAPPVDPRARSSEAHTSLFGPDVAVDTMPLSLAIRKLDGTPFVLFPRGTWLPAARTETFSTAMANQTSIRIDVTLVEPADPHLTMAPPPSS
jgi:molecular chaperone DnaK (HSP70)